MKYNIRNFLSISGLALFSVLLFLDPAFARQDQSQPEGKFVPDPEEFPYAADNENCLRCHADNYYVLTDPITGAEKRRNMNEHYRFTREDFYNSNHKSFACTDCHAYEFEEFPHPLETRLEEAYACIDCHGYDENYAQFHFEEIEAEYQESTHAHIEGFSCWKCHNAHTYKINVRNSTNLNQTIIYDNNICLECHAKIENFMLLTDREEIDIVSTHDWLPNQVAHFSSVRCIECHTRISDSILVAHDLRPKEEAVRRCTECHSRDSRLMSTLYKFQSKESRKSGGYVNAVILNESYVIGANRNIILNYASIIIFGFVLLIIIVHVSFRLVKKKNA